VDEDSELVYAKWWSMATKGEPSIEFVSIMFSQSEAVVALHSLDHLFFMYQALQVTA
jgi:hypothetical protein